MMLNDLFVTYPLLSTLCQAVVLLVAAKSSKLDLLSLGLPLLFTRPVLTVSEFFRKKEDAK